MAELRGLHAHPAALLHIIDTSRLQKVYSDDIATIHVRKAGAVHTADPTIGPTAL
jgi:hypothetical protein